MLLAQDVRQVAADERHICRAFQCAGNSELLVVGKAVDLFQVPVGTVYVRDPCAGQFLGQSALVRLERPLAASTRLRRVGRNMVNTQLLERPPYLRQVDLVDLATRLWGDEVVATAVAVQAGKQAIAC